MYLASVFMLECRVISSIPFLDSTSYQSIGKFIDSHVIAEWMQLHIIHNHSSLQIDKDQRIISHTYQIISLIHIDQSIIYNKSLIALIHTDQHVISHIQHFRYQIIKLLFVSPFYHQ